METFTTKLIKDGAGHKEVFNKMKEKLVELNNEQDGTKEFKRNKRKIMKDLKVLTPLVSLATVPGTIKGSSWMKQQRQWSFDVRDGIVKNVEKAYRHLEKMVESKKEESKETRDSGDCKEFYEEAMFLCQSM